MSKAACLSLTDLNEIKLHQLLFEDLFFLYKVSFLRTLHSTNKSLPMLTTNLTYSHIPRFHIFKISGGFEDR